MKIQKKIVIEGKRSQTDGIQYLGFDNKIKVANSIYELSNKPDIIKFLAAIMWNPILEIWIKAINVGFFSIQLGLTADTVKKYLDKSMEEAKEYLCIDCKNIRSTKAKLVEIMKDTLLNNVLI